MSLDYKELDKNKVVLGMSGGVDSTTAALLLQKKGFQVSGMYFAVCDKAIKGRMAAEIAFKEAMCQGKFEYIDARDEFNEIINNFCNEYISGRTPNPCVMCNPLIKFKHLIETADRLGAYYIATGHYAKIIQDTKGCHHIMMANSSKDQSYMLYRLPKEVLARLILPLGEMVSKEIVREIARENNIGNAEAADSQEICFLDDDQNYAEFIKNTLHNNNIVNKNENPFKEGNFIDINGNVLGKHKGIVYYTLGQRKGLGIALGRPAFVIDINPVDNTVTLGENSDLFKNTVISKNNFFVESGNGIIPKNLENKLLFGKIRYAAKLAKVRIKAENNLIVATFDEPQRAATKGQSIVFYDENVVVGGGIIC